MCRDLSFVSSSPFPLVLLLLDDDLLASEASAETTCCKKVRERLIAAASAAPAPVVPVFERRSLPARSTRCSLLVTVVVATSSPPHSSAPHPAELLLLSMIPRATCTVNTACDLDDRALSPWPLVALAAAPRARAESAASGLSARTAVTWCKVTVPCLSAVTAGARRFWWWFCCFPPPVCLCLRSCLCAAAVEEEDEVEEDEEEALLPLGARRSRIDSP